MVNPKLPAMRHPHEGCGSTVFSLMNFRSQSVASNCVDSKLHSARSIPLIADNHDEHFQLDNAIPHLVSVMKTVLECLQLVRIHAGAAHASLFLCVEVIRDVSSYDFQSDPQNCTNYALPSDNLINAVGTSRTYLCV